MTGGSPDGAEELRDPAEVAANPALSRRPGHVASSASRRPMNGEDGINAPPVPRVSCRGAPTPSVIFSIRDLGRGVASPVDVVRSGRAQRASRAARSSATSHAGPSAAVPRSQHASGRARARCRSSRPNNASLASTPRIAAADAAEEGDAGWSLGRACGPEQRDEGEEPGGQKAGRPATQWCGARQAASLGEGRRRPAARREAQRRETQRPENQRHLEVSFIPSERSMATTSAGPREGRGRRLARRARPADGLEEVLEAGRA